MLPTVHRASAAPLLCPCPARPRVTLPRRPPVSVRVGRATPGTGSPIDAARRCRGPTRPRVVPPLRPRPCRSPAPASQRAAWSAAAKDAGVGSLARWARERVTSSLTLAHLGHSDLGGEVAALRADLGRVGSNLNQIARALNVAERGGPDGPTPGEALDAIGAVRAQLAEIRAWTREHP